MWLGCLECFIFFFFNDTATTEIYTLSLHDALPIFGGGPTDDKPTMTLVPPSDPDHASSFLNIRVADIGAVYERDRKSTRLNSSHLVISYAVFCLKKKTQSIKEPPEAKLHCSLRHGD